jgi:hypothetical protein
MSKFLFKIVGHNIHSPNTFYFYVACILFKPIFLRNINSAILSEIRKKLRLLLVLVRSLTFLAENSLQILFRSINVVLIVIFLGFLRYAIFG